MYITVHLTNIKIGFLLMCRYISSQATCTNALPWSKGTVTRRESLGIEPQHSFMYSGLSTMTLTKNRCFFTLVKKRNVKPD